MIAHHLPQETLLEELQTSHRGLSTNEADRRLSQYGPNRLPKGRKVTLLQIILHQFMSPLIYVLIAAAILSVVIHEYIEAVFIVLVISINAIIGSIQEWGAESQASALQDMIKVEVRLRRDGSERMHSAEELVPGDIVLLESGMKVPADIRLLESNQLLTEEAALTGESLPVDKQAGNLTKAELPIGDRSNMLHAGTTVMRGRGLGIVVNTGKQTEIGQLAQAVAQSGKSETPLLKRMERFAGRITQVMLAASVLVVLIGLLRDYTLVQIFFISVALAVSAIPEGLPISMTIALSIGSLRMSKRHVIVRQLAAVEGLGSCTWIATDKTGTLTVDQQTVRQVLLPDGTHLQVGGEGYNPDGEIQTLSGAHAWRETEGLQLLLTSLSLCNEARLYADGENWKHQGDAIDVALLALVIKAGQEPDALRQQTKIVHEIPFESENQYAAVYFETPAGLQLAIKGATEALLPYLPAAQRQALSDQAHQLASEGFRVIAVAGQTLKAVPEHLPELVFQGFIALIDPIKPEALDAVRRCHEAGIEVSMITGDHPATALAIARELGIAHSEADVITGAALGEAKDIADPAYLQTLANKRVFARVSPKQKQQIVEGLTQLGHFVAVTGDGVNDAPALKKAHIGVAMGYGTDVAKEAASIIVTDNNSMFIAFA
ncbi:MAG: cation-transporting P-type ATPase [Candidatus Sericytochromatia bacterium]|nr:cation-transporting P-type ATPase [Candidatus Sericytochromatia bacterium]